MSHKNQNPQNSGEQPKLEEGLSPIEQEQLRLLDEQTKESYALEVLGIADKAREVLRERYADHVDHMGRHGIDVTLEDDPVLDGPSVRVAVARVRETQRDNTILEKPALRFSTTSEAIAPAGSTVVSHQYVDLTEGVVAGSGDEPVPTHDFTAQDVEIVEGMLMKRQQDYERGVFPHLNPDLASVFDPSSAMMALPPESK